MRRLRLFLLLWFFGGAGDRFQAFQKLDEVDRWEHEVFGGLGGEEEDSGFACVERL
jgi:hypothetical protein